LRQFCSVLLKLRKIFVVYSLFFNGLIKTQFYQAILETVQKLDLISSRYELVERKYQLEHFPLRMQMIADFFISEEAKERDVLDFML